MEVPKDKEIPVGIDEVHNADVKVMEVCIAVAIQVSLRSIMPPPTLGCGNGYGLTAQDMKSMIL